MKILLTTLLTMGFLFVASLTNAKMATENGQASSQNGASAQVATSRNHRMAEEKDGSTEATGATAPCGDNVCPIYE